MVPDTGRTIIILPIQDFYLDDIAAHLKANPLPEGQVQINHETYLKFLILK